jgi:hypothetical protein
MSIGCGLVAALGWRAESSTGRGARALPIVIVRAADTLVYDTGDGGAAEVCG